MYIDLSLPIRSQAPGVDFEQWLHTDGIRHLSRRIRHLPGDSRWQRVTNYFRWLTGQRRLSARDLPGGMFLSNEFYRMSVHQGTHVDAPFHYGPLCEGKAAKKVLDMPLDWFMGPGVVLDVRASDGIVTDKTVNETLTDAAIELAPGSIVLFRSDSDLRVGSPEYYTKSTAIAPSAVDELLRQGVKVIGTDSWSFDGPPRRMVESFYRTKDSQLLWPTHLHGRQREFVQIEGLANLRSIPGRWFTFVAFPIATFMPQWDFLDFLAVKGKMFSSFRLMQSAEVSDLIIEQGRVIGVRASALEGSLKVRADLIVAADGRNSTCRARSGLRTIAEAPYIDVLWFRVPRKDDDKVAVFQSGKGVLVAINRGDYWQIAYVIPPHAFAEVRAAGLAEFHARITSLAPVLGDRMSEINTWDKVHRLTVRVDRLKTWHRPGLLCIGDAAHAMSPAGGVGINLAVQDAVAAANILGPRLRSNQFQDSDLPLIQARREFPTRITQKFQVTILRDLYPKNLNDDTSYHPPPIFNIFKIFPVLRHVMGRFIGMGVRPEHIQD
jgi:2-polyprenyl-6-methoxyphenol hydroxylase-like FAD-dependent oxidoreductase